MHKIDLCTNLSGNWSLLDYYLLCYLICLFFKVTRDSHLYVKDIESREEGGTPAIIESIRAGLVFKLKEVRRTFQALLSLFVGFWNFHEI